jgi:hypothetical protein
VANLEAAIRPLSERGTRIGSDGGLAAVRVDRGEQPLLSEADVAFSTIRAAV